MPNRHHYRLPAESRGAGGIFLWLFVILTVAIIGFVWWKSQSPLTKSDTPKRPTAVIATNRPAAIPVAKTVAAVKATNAPAQNTPTSRPSPSVTNRPSASAMMMTNSVAKPAPKPEPVATAVPTNGYPRPPRDTLEVQIALARRAISSGSIDSVNGGQTRAAVLAFQRANGLTATGELDAATRAALTLEAAPLTSYIVTSNDLARLQPISKTWLGKSQQSALDYETLLELVAEKGHASPTLTRKLNPGVNWTNVAVGDELKIPAVEYPATKKKAAFIRISLAERRLQAFDENTNLLAHFPCSIAAKFEKRPVGELHVVAVAPNPDYTFNPEVFPESEEAQQLKTKLILPPGPNNPVGTAWISLDKPGYGMHGTPSPEQVGRTESHGCFRLANWNADYLIKLVWVGMPVLVEP
jgi:lipoprotein-anchoring transpeptidase ErfK/SrfK